MTDSEGDGNGWRAGTDPTLRWLRPVVVLGLMAVLGYITITSGEPQLFALALGGLLVLFGYGGSLQIIDFIVRRRDD